MALKRADVASTTWTNLVLSISGPKLDRDKKPVVVSYGEDKGKTRYSVACTGIRRDSGQPEIVRVGIISFEDPAEGIVPGTAIEFDGLVVKLMEPEMDGAKIKGGLMYLEADGLHALNGSAARS